MMAELYVNGKGESVSTNELTEHIENVRASHRTPAQQQELDLIWGKES